ncbi:transcriptional regulator of multidrug-efflux transporter genes [Bacillus sp. OxB-1]|uniref:MerR family transcriptional regulator n=1 Tax=Bacillus sp. (strain OxB-1) TaxID=98228 RepID=UPI000581EEF1|nr:MerR family transcriptional regulator [Bacillus sp. OxB-1]BAQ11920.1 transcriptional regulator of multidrug-efflux transporter genes [Bacillus sp. OxB-1]
MKNKFSIGQMSKLHNTSIKTLRYYDEIDLFKPNEVDPETGYRYYSVEQFKLLDIINYLKALGVPLKDIKKQTSNREMDDFIETLYTHKQTIHDKMKELEIAKKKLEIRIEELESLKKIKQIGVPFIKEMEERTIIQLQESIRSHYDLELSLRKLNRQHQDFASIFIGKVGLTLSVHRFQRNCFYEYDSIFLLLEEAEKWKAAQNVELVTTLPEGEYACVYFRGGHETAPEYVTVLHQYVLDNGLEPIGDFIIRTIVDQFISNKEDEFLMEIQIPVKRTGT